MLNKNQAILAQQPKGPLKLLYIHNKYVHFNGFHTLPPFIRPWIFYDVMVKSLVGSAEFKVHFCVQFWAPVGDGKALL